MGGRKRLKHNVFSVQFLGQASSSISMMQSSYLKVMLYFGITLLKVHTRGGGEVFVSVFSSPCYILSLAIFGSCLGVFALMTDMENASLCRGLR